MTRDIHGNLHCDSRLEQAALLVLWAEARGVKLSALQQHDIAVDVSSANIAPLTDAEFQGWIDFVGVEQIRAILVARQRPSAVH